ALSRTLKDAPILVRSTRCKPARIDENKRVTIFVAAKINPHLSRNTSSSMGIGESRKKKRATASAAIPPPATSPTAIAQNKTRPVLTKRLSAASSPRALYCETCLLRVPTSPRSASEPKFTAAKKTAQVPY